MKYDDLVKPHNSTNIHKKVANFISLNCKPFLLQVSPTEDLLWRGVTSHRDDYQLNVTHTDRIPKMTDPILHVLTDNFFEEKFGIRPRSSGVFTTGNRSQAADYGEPVIVFPVGNFKFVWSPVVADLAGLFEGNSQADLIVDIFDDEPERAYEMLVNLLEKQRYTTINLPEAINKGVEISIVCKQYITLTSSFFQEMVDMDLIV